MCDYFFKFILFSVSTCKYVRILLGVQQNVVFCCCKNGGAINNMSTTYCETGIVRIRVSLSDDILRFVYVLHNILYSASCRF